MPFPPKLFTFRGRTQATINPQFTMQQQENQPRILILGVGNTLLTDEGLGVHAVQLLPQLYEFPDNVSLLDGGTLGMHLIHHIQQCDRLIVIDAILGKHEPGTMYRLYDEGLRKSLGFSDSMHQVDLADALVICELSGNRPQGVVIGMEPLDWESLGIEPTPLIKEKLPELCAKVVEELAGMGCIARKK